MPTGDVANGPMDVLVITAEDGLADTIVPRLRAAGADPERVSFLELRERNGKALPFSVPEDMDRLSGALKATGARFVIIDPIAAFLSARIQSHNDASVRKAMARLAAVAEDTGAALLLVRHLNKSGGGNAMYRGGGSIAFTGAARSVMLAAVHPEDRTRRVLAQVKGNLSRGITPSREWRVISWPNEEHIPAISWGGQSPLSADELLATPDGRKDAPQRKAAEEWLKTVLADGPMPSTELVKAADEQGISERTLKRARAELTVTRAVRDEHGGLVSWNVSLRGQEGQ